MTDVDKEIKDEELKEGVADVPLQERAAAWDDYVRDQVNNLLDTYLPEAINGNMGIKYINPVEKVDVKTGNKIINKDKAKGVIITLMFEFPEEIEFFDEKPE